MSSGFFLVKSGGGHQGIPVRGSYRAEKTQRPGNLMDAADYPLTAECQRCHQPIRLATRNQMEWTHAPAGAAEAAAPAPPVGDAP